MAVSNKSTLAELDAALDGFDRERQLLRERARQVMALRNKKVREEQLDYWGLNESQYAAAKAEARRTGRAAHAVLGEYRAKANKDLRDVQTAQAEAAALKVSAKGV